MWGGYAWAGDPWAAQAFVAPSPVSDQAGMVYGGDGLAGNVVYGHDTTAADGIVMGGDTAIGVVYGSDGRAG